MNLFINHYIDEDGQNVECITKFFAYNKELINKDRERIFAYLIDTYGLDQESITVDQFLTSKSGQVINKLESIEDLDELEKTIGLAIESGLLIDDFRLRFNFLDEIGNNHIFLNRDNFDFTSPENTYLYLMGIKKHIINNQIFLVNMEIVKSYNKMKDDKSNIKKETIYTENELIECLFNWLINTSKIVVPDEIKDIYKFLLNNRLSDMVNFVTYLIKNNLSSDYLLMYFYQDSSLNILDEISKQVNNLSNEERNIYEDYRAHIINKLIEKHNNIRKHK